MNAMPPVVYDDFKWIPTGSYALHVKRVEKDGAVNLSVDVPPDQPIVLVCHPPYDAATWKNFPHHAIHAVLNGHAGHPAATSRAETLEMLAAAGISCPRVYGLTKGWNDLTPGERSGLLAFLQSNDATPPDAVARLIDGDAPAYRIALDIALRICREELAGPNRPMPYRKLLAAPAAAARGAGLPALAERLENPPQERADVAATVEDVLKQLGGAS